MKIHEISALGAKRYRNVVKSVPDVKITLFLQSVTWTCSKLHFSSIIVGYSSRIFDDFHGFSQISSISRIVLHASREANRFKTRSFSGFGMDPSNFWMKIHEISALGTKRYRNVTKSVPDVKIMLFCKVLPGRTQNCIFRRFL